MIPVHVVCNFKTYAPAAFSGTREGLLVHVEIGAGFLLLSVLDRFGLVDARAVILRVTAEGDLELLKKLVHPYRQMSASKKNRTNRN